MFNNAGRLRVNMGNIYFKLGQYAKAIKFYRMALDQVTSVDTVQGGMAAHYILFTHLQNVLVIL